MALTRISTDGIKDGTITGTDLATNVDLVDNKKIRFGTGNDLEIYHNGTASFISNTTGDLKIDSDNIKVRQSNGNAFIKCQSTAVELYYADNKKLQTSAGGVNVTGELNVTTKVAYPDNAKAIFGTGDDLQIYHNGNESWIKNNTGTLNVLNDGVFQFKNLADNETIAQFEADGACSLWYNNSKKFETTASGVDVTGNCTITGNFRGNDGVMLNLGNGDDLQIYHDGTDDRIMSGSTNSTIFASKYLRLMNQAANETMAKFFENGAVELYYDNSKKFETTNLGAQITGELSLTTHLKLLDDQKVVCGNGEDLLIYHDGTNTIIDNSTGVFVIKGDDLRLKTNSNNEDMIRCYVNGQVELYYNNSKKFETTNTGGHFTGKFTFNDGSSNQIAFGDSEDLQIYHNSNQNWIVSGSDNLYLKVADGNNDGKIRFLAADNSNMIECNNGDNVELYYNGSKKFETSGYGIKLHQLNTGAGNSDLRYNSSTGVVTYDTSSRLVKTDIEDSPYGIDIVKQLKPRKYKRTDQSNTPVEIGFVADEVQSLIPEVVPTGPKSNFTKNDSDTEIIPVNVDYRKLTVVLTTALQEAIAKIEVLETEVAALKAS